MAGMALTIDGTESSAYLKKLEEGLNEQRVNSERLETKYAY